MFKEFLEESIRSIGRVSRDTVELLDSTASTIVETATDTIDGIASIPDLLQEGYSKGMFSEGDTEEITSEEKDPKDIFPGTD